METKILRKIIIVNEVSFQLLPFKKGRKEMHEVMESIAMIKPHWKEQ